MLALLDITGFLYETFSRFNYSGPFLVLLLCGFLLPLPEEVTLIGSGLLLHKQEVEFVPISLVCMAAILLGDSVPFWLGRRYGLSAFKIRWVARLVHPERFSRLERKFQAHGNMFTFTCRFFAGVRIPGYFVAGMMGMKYPRFLLLDAMGAALTVPASIYLGKLFGQNLDRLRHDVHNFHLILAFLVVALTLILIVRARGRGRGEGPSAAPPTGREPGPAAPVAPEIASEAAQALEAGDETGPPPIDPPVRP